MFDTIITNIEEDAYLTEAEQINIFVNEVIRFWEIVLSF